MRFLCEYRRHTFATSPDHAQARWHHLMAGGAKAYKCGNYDKAYLCFGMANEIAGLILDVQAPASGQIHPVDMRVTASHNLAATLNIAGYPEQAETVLRQLYSELLAFCQLSQGRRQLRIAALARLDTALFSLTSQLGQAGKIDEIYRLIRESDQVGDSAARQLFH